MSNQPETKRQPNTHITNVSVIGTSKTKPYRDYETLGIVLDGINLELARKLGWKIHSTKESFFVEAAAARGENISYRKSDKNLYNVEVYGIEWTMRDTSGVKLMLVSVKPVI